MNKSQLVDRISDRTGVSKKDVGDVIEGMFVEVSHVVANGGDKLTLPGFLSFEQVKRAERKGFNPQTKEPITIPAGTAVKVSAGARLKAYAKGTEQPPK